MKRREVTRILVEGDKNLAQTLALEIEKVYQIEMLHTPARGLVMAKAKDGVSGQSFYVGEVLVTECTLTVNQQEGFGIVMGEDLEKAYHLAIIDAAYSAKFPETQRWLPLLQQEEENILNRNSYEQLKVKGTKVQFDTMEDYNVR